MSFSFIPKWVCAPIVAISVVSLAGCAAGGGSNGLGAVPATPAQTGFVRFGSSGPVLQTLDVPLRQFPNAVGTLLTGIRGNLITGFVANKNGSNIGVVYDLPRLQKKSSCRRKPTRKKPRASMTRSEQELEMEHDKQHAGVLDDFVYLDRKRIGALAAQLFDSGLQTA